MDLLRLQPPPRQRRKRRGVAQQHQHPEWTMMRTTTMPRTATAAAFASVTTRTSANAGATKLWAAILMTTLLSGTITFGGVCAVSCALQKSLFDTTSRMMMMNSSSSYFVEPGSGSLLRFMSGLTTVHLGSIASYSVAQTLWLQQQQPRAPTISYPWSSPSLRTSSRLPKPFRRLASTLLTTHPTIMANDFRRRIQQRTASSLSFLQHHSSKRRNNRKIRHAGGTTFDSYPHIDSRRRKPFTTNLSPQQQQQRAVRRICVVVGIISYLVLSGGDGQFRRIGPSHYTRIGSFARKSLPATDRYATSSQRTLLQQLGRQYGCHTCGYKGRSGSLSLQRLFQRTTKSLSRRHYRRSVITAEFVGDHMPPRSIARQLNQKWYRQLLRRPIQYRFYPQCMKCSNYQGSLLSAATATSAATSSTTNAAKSMLQRQRPASPYHFHGYKPRLHHWTGGIVASMSLFLSNNDNDISNVQRNNSQQRTRTSNPRFVVNNKTTLQRLLNSNSPHTFLLHKKRR